jgi:hypothetical protein
LSIPEVVELREGQSPPPHPRGASYAKPIDAAKEAVPVLDLAERLASEQGKTLMGCGKELVVSCLLPNHDDPSPSFYVNTEKGVFWCHGCGRGGDVVHLAALVWGHDDMVSAAVDLLLTFGHELPQRPPSWYAKQARQQEVRNRAHRGRIEHVGMLVFRLVWMPWLRTLPEWVRNEAKESAWQDSLWMAERLYASRRSG